MQYIIYYTADQNVCIHKSTYTQFSLYMTHTTGLLYPIKFSTLNYSIFYNIYIVYESAAHKFNIIIRLLHIYVKKYDFIHTAAYYITHLIRTVRLYITNKTTRLLFFFLGNINIYAYTLCVHENTINTYNTYYIILK